MKELAIFAANVVDDLNTRPPAALSAAVPLRCDFRCTNALSEFAPGSDAFDCIHFGAATDVCAVHACIACVHCVRTLRTMESRVLLLLLRLPVFFHAGCAARESERLRRVY
jgi:hypothetical protein